MVFFAAAKIQSAMHLRSKSIQMQANFIHLLWGWSHAKMHDICMGCIRNLSKPQTTFLSTLRNNSRKAGGSASYCPLCCSIFLALSVLIPSAGVIVSSVRLLTRVEPSSNSCFRSCGLCVWNLMWPTDLQRGVFLCLLFSSSFGSELDGLNLLSGKDLDEKTDTSLICKNAIISYSFKTRCSLVNVSILTC